MKKQSSSIVKVKTSNRSLFLSAITALFMTLSFSNQAQTQIYVNISSQALWGPVGYDHVDYYYLPEADAFYSVSSKKFIYWNGHQNVYVNTLPSSRTVNLFTTYKVVVNQPKPYLNHGYYVSHYKKYKHGGPKQYMIKDSQHEKYFVVLGHPHHGKGKGNNVQNNHGNKLGKGNPNAHKSLENKSNNKSKGGKGNSGKGGKKGHK